MKQIKKIVIVGGGTSAWLSAAYLNYNLPDAQVVVIDKEIGSPVGVGEGTLLNFKPFMESCGFPLDEWFCQISATFKAGILFKNWQEENKDIWHPFALNPALNENFNQHDIWTNHQDLDYKYYGTAFYKCSVDLNRINRNYDYAYHVDCAKLVKYIQSKILKRGVEYIQSEVVLIDKQENINKLVLKNEDIITADLYIDCTGFISLLQGKESSIDLKDRLFCDTAVAGHVPYLNRNKELTPYVISEAVDHGWIWKIPVHDRIGSGLVFNRSITDPETAKEYFCAHWNYRISPDNLKIIDWSPYYKKQMWSNNCISIGLSAGFIEPLESTGIALIMEGIYQLTNRICDYRYNNLDQNLFNNSMQSFFEESIDFVNMHYFANTKNTKFWNFVNETHKMNETHKHFLDILENSSGVVPYNSKNTNFFTANNWMAWLFQMNNTAVSPRTFVNNNDKENSIKLLQNWNKEHNEFIELFTVDHEQEIDRIYNSFNYIHIN